MTPIVRRLPEFRSSRGQPKIGARALFNHFSQIFFRILFLRMKEKKSVFCYVFERNKLALN